MTGIPLGKYQPGSSAVHLLDPRTKMAGLVVYLAVLFLVKHFVMLALPLLFVAAVLVLSDIPVRYLYTSVAPMKWLLVFLFLLNLLMTPGETVLLKLGPLVIRREALLQACFVTVRLILLISGASLLTLTTSPIGLTDGLEALLTPLTKLKFPAHEIALMLTIALRFIPTLAEETERIRKAQLSRGADLESGGLFSRLKAMLPIMTPLFVSAFRRADELAMAMDARCYAGGGGRTRLNELKMRRGDALAFLVLGAFLAAAVLLDRTVLA